MSPKLKHKKGRQVAPLAGAWIEIYYIMIIDNLRCVAPLAGAWIEMSMRAGSERKKIMSLPSRERGLKFMVDEEKKGLIEVAPLAGAWIEIVLKLIV